MDKTIIHCSKDVMSGIPVFVGTRVPIQTLFDYLEDGQPLSEFLDDFPSVAQEQATALLELAKKSLMKPHERAA